MALFTNRYSGLLTKGLGLPACEGLITMNFHLFSIEVTPPTTPGKAGGGPYPVIGAHNQATPQANPMFFTPKLGKDWSQSTRIVNIKVNIAGKKFQKYFIVDEFKANIIVKAINVTNKLTGKVKVIVSAFRSLFDK